jgi:hypothetical protein
MFLDTEAFRMTAVIFVLTTITIFLIRPSMFFTKSGELRSPITMLVFLYGGLVILYLLLLILEVK